MRKEKTIKQKCKMIWDNLPKGEVYFFSGSYYVKKYINQSFGYCDSNYYATSKKAKEVLYLHNIELFLNAYQNQTNNFWSYGYDLPEKIIELKRFYYHYDLLEILVED